MTPLFGNPPGRRPGEPSRRTSAEPRSAAGKPKARRWPDYLLAILAGNIIFLLVEAYLPVAVRHQTFRVDWGLAVDFAICVAVYGAIRFWRRE